MRQSWHDSRSLGHAAVVIATSSVSNQAVDDVDADADADDADDSEAVVALLDPASKPIIAAGQC